MGTVEFAKQNEQQGIRMSSSYKITTSSSTSSSSTSKSTLARDTRARSEMEMTFDALNVDRSRFRREFMTPEPSSIKLAGSYYPRYKSHAVSSTGTSYVSYLARPCYDYRVPSKFGFSKYINVAKL